MKRVKFYAIVLLSAAALMPALWPRQSPTKIGALQVPIVAAFGDTALPSIDRARAVDVESVTRSIDRYRNDGTPSFDEEIHKRNLAAYNADPKVIAAKQAERDFWRVFGGPLTSRAETLPARDLVALSAGLVLGAAVLVLGVRSLRRGAPVLGALLMIAPLAALPLAFASTGEDSTAVAVPLLAALHRVPTEPYYPNYWSNPAPQGAVWTPAAIEETRPFAEKMVSVEVATLGDRYQRDDVLVARRALGRQVRWCMGTALVAGLAVVVLRRRPTAGSVAAPVGFALG